MTAPFHRVGFADFWLADQLNSLVVVLMDLEYMICFYSFELDWTKHNGLISRGEMFAVHAYVRASPWLNVVLCR